MPKPPKKRQNGYLYQLLQWLVRIEVTYFNGKMLDDKAVYDLFYKRALKERAEAFPEEEKADQIAAAMKYASSFYKTVWEAHPDKAERYYKGYKYTDAKLDELTSYVQRAGPFESWKIFCEYFENDEAAMEAEKVRDVPFFKLPQNFIGQIIAASFQRYAQINYFLEASGKLSGEDYNVIVDKKESFIIRAATEEDIRQIEAIAENIYPCSINRFELKKPWHTKNPNVFFVHLGSFNNVHANINLLPITNECYQDLRSGRRYENTITVDDIIGLENKNEVNYIYIEGLACMDKSMQPHLASYLPKMIQSIANPDSANLTICAMGGSVEAQLLLKNHGFKKTGIAIDPADGSEYEFLETKWKELYPLVSDIDEHWRHEGKASISKGKNRLTKIIKKSKKS